MFRRPFLARRRRFRRPVRRRWFRPFLLALPVALVLAGCGAAATDPGSTTGSTPGSTPGSTRGSTPGSTAGTTPSSTVGTTVPPSTEVDGPRLATGTHQVHLTVDGLERTATVTVPAGDAPAPLVFAFHGHGGNGRVFARQLQLGRLWPEAIVVYPDGLVGHKGKTDPEGVKPGWQTEVGEDGDRDLHLYDALLAAATAQLHVDPERIYVVGHSNGSQFAGLVLNQRGAAIAAAANLSATPNAFLGTDPVRSMFFAMGEQDPIVPIAHQQAAIPLAEAKLGADPASAIVDGFLRREPGDGDLELATYVHPGGHDVPDAVPPLVVAFFQRHTLSGG